MHFQEGSRKKLILSSRGKGLHNGACVKHFKCGSIPKNAAFYDHDDKDLSSSLVSIYSPNNTNRKCEWRCEEGSVYERTFQGVEACIKGECLPNEKAIGADTSKCSTYSDFHCEIRYWDGITEGFCGVWGNKSLLNEHECLYVVSDSPTQRGPIISRNPDFIGRFLYKMPPAISDLSYYAVPTICKWVD